MSAEPSHANPASRFSKELALVINQDIEPNRNHPLARLDLGRIESERVRTFARVLASVAKRSTAVDVQIGISGSEGK